MSTNPTVIIGLLSVVLVCLFAAIKGGPAERFAAYVIGAAWLASVAGRLVFGREHVDLVLLATDGIASAALLFVAIRFASLWLGVAMMLQSTAFALHAAYTAESPIAYELYISSMNGLAYALLFTLLGATLTAWHRRTRSRGEVPLPAAA